MHRKHAHRNTKNRNFIVLIVGFIVLLLLASKVGRQESVTETVVAPTVRPTSSPSTFTGILSDFPKGTIPAHGTLYVVKKGDTYGIYNTDPDKQTYIDDWGVTHVDAKMGSLTLEEGDEQHLVFFESVTDYQEILAPGIPNSVSVTGVEKENDILLVMIVYKGTSTTNPDITWKMTINLETGAIEGTREGY